MLNNQRVYIVIVINPTIPPHVDLRSWIDPILNPVRGTRRGFLSCWHLRWVTGYVPWSIDQKKNIDDNKWTSSCIMIGIDNDQ